jgi:signal transduction histidine kinase
LAEDAPADARLAGTASVARHRLRQVICVPLAGRHGVLGVLFLGGRRPGGFTPDHLDLAAAVGHLAAVAVEEARATAARVQAERLAAVGETMAATGHHIKNVMQGVRTGGDLVRLGLADADLTLVAKGWRLVERNQARIDALMLDLLGYAKGREPGREPTDLAALVADVLEVVRGRAAECGVALTLEAGDAPPVPCDPDGVHRAVLNVVSNAVDAVEGGGRVTVSLGVRAGFAEVVVADTGPGVPADAAEAIFRPFVSGKGGRGTGLGLPVSRKTLREHGGDVVAVPGPGGRFVLTLPLTPSGRISQSGT